MSQPSDKGRILVAIPCRDSLPTATAKSIAATVKAGYDVVFSTGGGLPNARNEILRQSVKEGYDAVLMIDSDMVWLPEHVASLVHAQANSPHEPSILSGRYYSRSPPHHVHAYRDGNPWPSPKTDSGLQTRRSSARIAFGEWRSRPPRLGASASTPCTPTTSVRESPSTRSTRTAWRIAHSTRGFEGYFEIGVRAYWGSQFLQVW